MSERLSQIAARLEELSAQLRDPASGEERAQELAREAAELAAEAGSEAERAAREAAEDE